MVKLINTTTLQYENLRFNEVDKIIFDYKEEYMELCGITIISTKKQEYFVSPCELAKLLKRKRFDISYKEKKI